MHVVCKWDECAGTAKHNIIYEIHRITRKCLWDILPWVWHAQHNSDQVSYSKMKKQTWKHVKQASYNQYRQNPFNKLNKINPTHIRTSHFSNLNNSKIKKSKVIDMKCFEKNTKPIPFLEDWSRDDEEKWCIFVRNMVSLWERWMDKTMNSQNERGKTKMFLKTILKSQNTWFLQLKWVANKSLKPLRQKLEKFV